MTDAIARRALPLRTLAIALVLVAFAMRLYHLDFQSLEGDEGISLQRSSQPLGQMMERMPVEHVPGYFVLLNGWLAVAGEEDFALRYLSVWPSVAAVALIYRWAASMWRPVTRSPGVWCPERGRYGPLRPTAPRCGASRTCAHGTSRAGRRLSHGCGRGPWRA